MEESAREVAEPRTADEEGRALVLSAASAKRDQGPSAASEAAGHDNDGT